MKKLFLLSVLMLLQMLASAGSGAATKRTIHVATAGTLPDSISETEKYNIDELIVGVDGVPSEAYDVWYEGSVSDSQGVKYTANDDESTCYVSGYEINHSPTITIPEVYEGRMVTSIGNFAFSNCSGLTSVIIPNSVRSIGGCAFRNCSSLISVIIPNSVNSIGDYAFENCSGLTSVTIPNRVTSIGDYAFFRCNGLTSVIIGNRVVTIGKYAFYSCSGLTSVIIPNSVRSIGSSAFVGCSGLNSIVVENDNPKYDSRNNCNAIIETATNTLLYGCNNTIIPISVTFIGDYALYKCSGLTSVTISNNVTHIGSHAFCGCSGLTSVTIPNSVTTIGYGAFQGCSSLTSVTISNSVTRIGDYTFYEDSGLTSVNIPDSVTSIGNGAFGGCSGLTSVTIPNSVTSIGSYAFSGCSGLTSVTIPNSVTSIGYYAFEQCSGLSSVIIPSSVTSIGYYVFSGCSGLTSVIIPNSVTSIGNYSFFGCSGLTSVTIGNGVMSIGEMAFRDCSSLTSVTIPNSVTSIGRGAFHDCSGLTSVTIPNSVTSIGNGAFFGCSDLTSVTIPNSVTSIGDAAFFRCSGLTSIIVENDNPKYDSRNNCNAIIETTTNTLLYGCMNTVIPNSVTFIAKRAFEESSGLTSVTIPNSVISIGESAFQGCSGLTSMTVYAKTPISIDDNCFTNRANATLYVPEGCKEAYQAAPYWNEFKEIIAGGLPAVDGDENVDFGDEINDDTNLDGNVVGDIYYVISSGDGSYNAGEGCIVVTKPTDDTAIDGQDIFGEDFKDNYTGIVFKVPAGKGTVTVEAKTEGNMVLKVKIGDAAPISMELEGRLKVIVPYDVTEPTNVYIYGGSKPAAAPATRRAATESGELKLYGFTVTSSATGIKDASRDNTITDSRYYTLDGRALDGVPTKKGIYIVNGRSVVVK